MSIANKRAFLEAAHQLVSTSRPTEQQIAVTIELLRRVAQDTRCQAHGGDPAAPWAYVCGPMSGLPDLNFPAFHAEAGRLRALGYNVVNPAEINADQPGWNPAMRADIREMMHCDTLVRLPGWDRSKGGCLETTIGVTLEFDIKASSDITSAP